MQVGTLIRNKCDPNMIGMIVRYNIQINSYTIYWVATGWKNAKYEEDLEILCEEN